MATKKEGPFFASLFLSSSQAILFLMDFAETACHHADRVFSVELDVVFRLRLSLLTSRRGQNGSSTRPHVCLGLVRHTESPSPRQEK